MSENHPPCPDTITGIPIQSTLSAPIRSGDKLLGLLSLDSYKKNIFNDSDMEIIRYLQEQLAVLLDNQNTFQNILNQSRYDSMTGLISRQFFDEQLHDAIKRAGRNNTSFVIVLMDMDNLKIINDRWGHMAGDKIIRVFSSAISCGFRGTDLFGRLGGDEFGGIIFDTSLEAVEKKFSSLQSEAPGVHLGERYFPCAFSYGIAEFGKDGETAEELLDKADYKMYRMKRSRKKSSDSLSNL
jgi:diguanylate cyclase (GGDEF)-like protein